MRPSPIALATIAVFAIGLLAWTFSAKDKPTPDRMVPIAHFSPQIRASSNSASGPDSESPDPLGKSLSKLAAGKVSELESQATALVKRTDVATLDPVLHSQRFEEWFRQTMGPENSYSWELNDCGEAVGVPEVDQQRDMPICIEARAQGPQEMEMDTSVMLQVGTERKGLFAKPVLRGIVQMEGEEFIDIKHLHDLPNLVPVN